VNVILSIDAVKYPLTGIGRYAYELANHLRKIKEIDSLRFFRGSRFCDNLIVEEGLQPSSKIGLRMFLRKSRAAVSLYSLVSSYQTKGVLSDSRDAVFHGPNYYLPDFGGPSVATIHDISLYVMKSWHPPERVRFMKKEISKTLKRATMLITDSEHTRREVSNYFSYPLARIRAVPLASSGSFYPRDLSDLETLRTKYRLEPGQYCLYTGTIEPRKNIIGLLNAYEMLPESVRRQWPLILSGYEGWNSADIHARIDKAKKQGWARYLGFVDAADLPLLYAGARLFAFPSLYEGFGLPVLEAMASGVPVVCSNTSSLPEVVGDSAAMCDAQDIDQLSDLILQGLEDDVWRDEAINKGISRAVQFSWQRCAEETAQVYRDVLAQSGDSF
jgi:alpha-1,3-rhamnosyl/mannosyltransferase